VPVLVREILQATFEKKMSESFSYQEFCETSYQEAIAAQVEQLRQFIVEDVLEYWPIQRK
jgi:hypothetical protein